MAQQDGVFEFKLKDASEKYLEHCLLIQLEARS